MKFFETCILHHELDMLLIRQDFPDEVGKDINKRDVFVNYK